MTDDEMAELCELIENDEDAAIRARLEAGLAPDTKIRRPGAPMQPLIVIAGGAGADAVIAALEEAGAEIDLPDDEGYTALMRCVLGGHKWSVMTLVQAGADVALTAPDGRTALDMTDVRGIRAMLGDEEAIKAPASTSRPEPEDDDEPRDDARAVPTELTAAALEAYYGRALPAALRAMYDGERWKPVDGKKFPMPTYRGGIFVRFADAPGLLEDAGDHDEDAAAKLLPLAAIYLNEEHRDAQFLLVQADDPACPVVMFEHESGKFMPVADSLEAFLASAM